MGILILMGILNSAFFCCNLILMLMLSLAEISVQTDTINPSLPISDGESLVSKGEEFQFGFFSPSNSNRRYVGIWYYKKTPQTVVWVANREIPLYDTSGVLKIGVDGNLILLNHTEKVVWSTNIHSTSSSQVTTAQLLDSGNLVLRGDQSKVGTESYLWESFDHPSDTLLSGIKLGINPVTGLNQYLTSWKSADDPSPGEFFYGVDPRGLPQLVLRKGSVTKFRSGPWNGKQFSGIPVTPNLIFNPTVLTNSEATYYEFVPDSEAPASMSVLTYSGVVQRYVWNSSGLEWLAMHVLPGDPCDNYEHCGPNSICTIGNSQTCSCLAGYVPKSLQDWELQVWSGGCVPKHSLNCSRGEGFAKIKGVKMPNLLQFWINTTMTLKECEAECRKNCSCTAYATSNATGKKGSGCLLWFGDLIDIRTLAENDGQRLYIRVTASDLDSQNKKKVLPVVTITASITLVGISIAFCIITRRRRRQLGPHPNILSKDVQDVDLPFFSLVTVEEATDKFSNSNKIGEGGFGYVYKGQLLTGQKIAIKRLSENSNQGLHEFKNEVVLISKLQHRNLVRLLGCCIQGEERMLIYEYMPNGSLSSFLFGNRNNPLVWSMRFDIIVGIARGLLYLHRDSRLRIIHRDLKASNVLLDNEMNPKISDFGIARAFRGDQLRDKTTRVVGTHGYMSPEYIIHGLFSIKSDVFSFGVLVLEIVSNKRNREFYHPDHNLSLLGYAWKLWVEGKVSELVEEEIKNSFSISEVLKCIQVGLLCVQQHPEDRPTMSTVLLWLDSESIMLPQPKQPAFCSKRFTIETELPWLENQHATNKMTLTLVEGR